MHSPGVVILNWFVLCVFVHLMFTIYQSAPLHSAFYFSGEANMDPSWNQHRGCQAFRGLLGSRGIKWEKLHE